MRFHTAAAKDGSRRYKQHARCLVRLWSVAPGDGLPDSAFEGDQEALGSPGPTRPFTSALVIALSCWPAKSDGTSL
jgi:hypothetical protein